MPPTGVSHSSRVHVACYRTLQLFTPPLTLTLTLRRGNQSDWHVDLRPEVRHERCAGPLHRRVGHQVAPRLRRRQLWAHQAPGQPLQIMSVSRGRRLRRDPKRPMKLSEHPSKPSRERQARRAQIGSWRSPGSQLCLCVFCHCRTTTGTSWRHLCCRS